jgi:anti-sigma factor RsiW
MMRVKNLFVFLRRSHKPDAEALSALADGELDAARARALEAHLAACEACTARLEELKRVQSMLAAMPQADAPRSFRLRRADVEAPARPAPVFMPGLLRALPAASGVAALAFVLVLATDFSTRDGGGGRTASLQSSADSAPSSARMESKSAEAPAGAAAADRDDEAADAAQSYFDADGTAAAGGAPVDAPAMGVTGGEPATAVAGAIDENAPPATASGEGLTQVADEYEAATAEAGDDDDGSRAAFLAVEIIAAGIAIAAGAAFAVSRRKRRVQS